MASDLESSGYTEVERSSAAQLFEQHYEDLVRLARGRRRRANMADTLMTQDIVHESFLKLGQNDNWQNSNHFLCSASLAIRHVIIDHARRKLTAKRKVEIADGQIEPENIAEYSESPEELVAIGNLMDMLEAAQPRWAKIVDARYFAGMTEDETASMLGISDRTVRRDWTEARAWLAEKV